MCGIRLLQYAYAWYCNVISSEVWVVVITRVLMSSGIKESQVLHGHHSMLQHSCAVGRKRALFGGEGVFIVETQYENESRLL